MSGVNFDEVVAYSAKAIEVSLCFEFEVQKANQITNTDLRASWAKVGVPEDEQKVEVSKLRDVIFACFDERVRVEQTRITDLEAEISEGATKIELLVKELANDNTFDANTVTLAVSEGTLLERQATTVSQLKSLESRKSDWVEKLGQRLKTLSEASAELAEAVEEDFAEIGEFSQKRLADFDSMILKVQKEIENRKAAVATVMGDIADFWAILEEGPRTELDRLIEKHADDPASIGVTAEMITALTSRANELKEEKDGRLDHVQSLGASITVLWDELEVAEEERATFFGEHKGLGMKTVKACEAELLRMQELKKEKIGELVTSAREHVISLWDEIHASPEERSSVPEMKTLPDEMTEATYDALKAKAEQLEERAKRFRPILQKIRKRDELLKEKEVYAALLADPTRLLSRKRRVSAFEEAKMANRVTKVLPKLTAGLRKRVKAWEAEEGNTELYIGGRRYLDVLEEQENAAKAAKAAKAEAKKMAKKKAQEHEMEHGSKARRRLTSATGRQRKKGGTIGKSRGGVKRSAKENSTVPGNVVSLSK